jgi:para-nitrobenzyl esterase
VTVPRTAPRFTCPAGTFLGRHDDGVVRATGIRYARAARWAPPEPEPPADGPVDATAWAPACPQPPDPGADVLIGPGVLGDLPFDEHCQRLSVTVPADAAADERLPVMVQIHGGAYVYGAGDAPLNDPAALVREQRVVAVTVTYRLGLLGFLGDTGGRPANLGLLDQIEALRWVRRNIAGFGGDADAVTLFGSSAGGDAIAHLMIADGAAGLFRRAVLQSAPLGISRGRAAMAATMARAAAHLSPDAPVAEVVAAQAAVERRARRHGAFVSGMPFGTQYGFAPLPAEDDVEAAWSRAAPAHDVLIGRTDREGAMFLPDPLEAALARLPVVGPRAREGLVRWITRRVYGTAVDTFARRHTAAGGRAHRYLLRYGDPANPLADAHGTDLPLLFPDRALWGASPLLRGVAWADVERHGRALRALWAGFARTGEAASVPGLVQVWPSP